MDFSFTAEQEELAALVRRILERDLDEERRRAVDSAPDRFDVELYRTLAGAGAVGVGLPSELGGGGCGLIEECVVYVEAGRTVAPVVLVAPMVAAGAVARFGSPEQAQAWVAPVVAGEQVITPALVEEGSTDVAAPQARAERVAGGFLLHGTKTTVPAGPFAEVVLVPASSDDGVTVFAVRPDDDGVRIEPQVVTDGSTEALLELDGVRLEADRVVGEVGQGAEIVRWMHRRATVGFCALQLGICRRALELTADYSKQRVQFDRPIATFQAVGQRLADAYIDVRGIELTLWQAAWRLEAGLDADTEIQTAKFWAAEAGHRVAHTAVHVHGGIGIDLDYHLHRYFVAAKRIEFALGGATEQLAAIGRTMADEPV